jgi:hypothetical protein
MNWAGEQEGKLKEGGKRIWFNEEKKSSDRYPEAKDKKNPNQEREKRPRISNGDVLRRDFNGQLECAWIGSREWMPQ